MTIGQSVDFLGAANEGRRAFLDLGSDNAAIEVYSTTRPADGDPAGGTAMLTIVLAKPCGTVTSGLLVLEANDPEGELIMSDGTPLWARFFNGNGDWAFDADVSIVGGAGEVQFLTASLLAGGRAPLQPSYIG